MYRKLLTFLMSRNKHPHFNILTALIVGIALIPVATQTVIDGPEYQLAELVSLFRSTDDNGRYFESAPDIRAYANANRAAFRSQRRAYSRAIDRCRNRLRDGEDIKCPDFNDFNSYIEERSTKAVAPVVEEVVKEVQLNTDVIKLTRTQRKTLRTYVRAGFCSVKGGDLIYRLCKSLVDEGATGPIGYINDNVKLHSMHASPPTTLKLRLQMVDDAISGIHGKRSDGTRPMRPKSRRVTGDY